MRILIDFAIIRLHRTIKAFKKALEDHDLRITYESRIADVLLAAYIYPDKEPDIMDYDQRMKIARDILNRILGD